MNNIFHPQQDPISLTVSTSAQVPLPSGEAGAAGATGLAVDFGFCTLPFTTGVWGLVVAFGFCSLPLLAVVVGLAFCSLALGWCIGFLELRVAAGDAFLAAGDALSAGAGAGVNLPGFLVDRGPAIAWGSRGEEGCE
jgi:hypothetical protein